jgi:hypothetical protein
VVVGDVFGEFIDDETAVDFLVAHDAFVVRIGKLIAVTVSGVVGASKKES